MRPGTGWSLSIPSMAAAAVVRETTTTSLASPKSLREAVLLGESSIVYLLCARFLAYISNKNRALVVLLEGTRAAAMEGQTRSTTSWITGEPNVRTSTSSRHLNARILPVHFRSSSWSYDACMDEFTPGQSIQMQAAWENYRHLLGSSETYTLAADGITCSTGSQHPTSNPTVSYFFCQ